MLKLSGQLTLDKETIGAPNLTDRFSAQDLQSIGDWCSQGYTIDKQSRVKWEKRTEAAMDLAMQIQTEKTFPWPNCSNVAFPLVTIAVTQFHARAYPAILNGPEVVKYQTVGSDPDGKEKGRADRIGLHMSWQLMEQDKDWEPQHDRMLINIATVGCAFKKTYDTERDGFNKSDLVMAKDLVLDYYARSVEDCPRKTHVIPLFRNEIYERIVKKTFRDIREEGWYKSPVAPQQTVQTVGAANRQGSTQPAIVDETTPFIFLEQHCVLDLDGDGYAEPYIITIEQVSKCVVRIVCRFNQDSDIERSVDGEIIRIRAVEYFTKYPFIPSPDGGIYDIGFGVLLGPLNESSNSLINQLIDAGTMSTTAGGFLGRGAKIRGGVYTFAPFQWQRVDSTGDDLRKSVFPLPVREPSTILFQLLSFIVTYTNRISGSTDIMVGESVGQNTPADTARQMQAEGMKIYNAIFKRIWTAMKEEFRKLYILNAYRMPDQMTFGLDGQPVSRQDYMGDPTRVRPVADPNTTTQADRLQQAMLLKQASASTPGYNVMEVEKIFLRANNIPNIEMIYNPEKFPPGEDLKITLKKMDLEREQMRIQAEQQQHLLDLQTEMGLNQAQIAKIEAEIMQIEAEVMNLAGEHQSQAMAKQVEHFKGMIEAMKSRNDVLMQMIQRQTMEIQARMKVIEQGTAMVKHATAIATHEAKKKELANAGKDAN